MVTSPQKKVPSLLYPNQYTSSRNLAKTKLEKVARRGITRLIVGSFGRSRRLQQSTLSFLNFKLGFFETSKPRYRGVGDIEGTSCLSRDNPRRCLKIMNRGNSKWATRPISNYIEYSPGKRGSYRFIAVITRKANTDLHYPSNRALRFLIQV